MKCIVPLLALTIFCSCSDSFINHELKAERLGDCTEEIKPINMVSNINGERYEFEYCLPDGFDGKSYTVDRKGDSLIVNFPKATAKKALYKLTLDIDAKPVYHHILLGNRTVEVVQAER